MRFLSFVRVNENRGMQPSEQLMAELGRLIADMTQSGVLLETAGCGVRQRACACVCPATH